MQGHCCQARWDRLAHCNVSRKLAHSCRALRCNLTVCLRRDSGKYTFSVCCYMLELYQDDLADLLLPVQPKASPPAPLHIVPRPKRHAEHSSLTSAGAGQHINAMCFRICSGFQARHERH